MAGYDPSKDEKIKEWRSPDTFLVVSINRYAEGQPKVQIGPRIYKKQDGSDRAPVRAGRLSLEDMDWFMGIADEVMENLKSLIPPE